jgi:hypothetical protein
MLASRPLSAGKPAQTSRHPSTPGGFTSQLRKAQSCRTDQTGFNAQGKSPRKSSRDQNQANVYQPFQAFRPSQTSWKANACCRDLTIRMKPAGQPTRTSHNRSNAFWPGNASGQFKVIRSVQSGLPSQANQSDFLREKDSHSKPGRDTSPVCLSGATVLPDREGPPKFRLSNQANQPAQKNCQAHASRAAGAAI